MASDKVVLDNAKLRQLMETTPAKVELWLDGFTEDLLSRIKLSFGTSPSKPGDPPGVDTGALRASMHWERTGPFERTISDGVEYGLWLEEGTSTIRPRPFIQPAFADAGQRIGEDAKQNLGLEDL